MYLKKQERKIFDQVFRDWLMDCFSDKKTVNELIKRFNSALDEQRPRSLEAMVVDMFFVPSEKKSEICVSASGAIEDIVARANGKLAMELRSVPMGRALSVSGARKEMRCGTAYYYFEKIKIEKMKNFKNFGDEG